MVKINSSILLLGGLGLALFLGRSKIASVLGFSKDTDQTQPVQEQPQIIVQQPTQGPVQGPVQDTTQISGFIDTISSFFNNAFSQFQVPQVQGAVQDTNTDPDRFIPKDGRGFTGPESLRDEFEAGLVDQFGRSFQILSDRPLNLSQLAEQNKIVSNVESFPTRTDAESIITSISNEQNLGGGPSFIGGTTTFRNNIVDTLSEVLGIFPNLTASQARDALEEFPGLLPGEFKLINPDVRNISNLESENVIFNQASDPRFTGMTPEQIALILTGGNISNF